MIVYGDPAYAVEAADLLRRLRRRAELADVGGVDERRALLIETGQFEQALADQFGDSEGLALTDLAAAVFLGDRDASVFRRTLDGTELPVGLSLSVKVPEGFAFYALYPEQYARSAESWLLERGSEPAGKVVVIGIRSIGTGLSAVVGRVLANAGWKVQRWTVRPTGPPYERHVEIPGHAVNGVTCGIIVDEGPGRSGSSMVAAAEALIRAGLARTEISFFPGHNLGPGPCATESVRSCWSTVRQSVVGLDELSWDGRSLPEALACRGKCIAARVEDLSGGNWRRVVFPNEAEWPAAFLPFERTKYRVVQKDGSALLWKFEGLAGGMEQSIKRLAELARFGWTMSPVDCAYGFLARPWIAGRPLGPGANRNLSVLTQIGRYIAESAGPIFSIEEQRRSLDRLRDMLYWNTWESLGEAAAEATRRVEEVATEEFCPSYGDGRLGPEEWILQPDGRLMKVDCTGHAMDHTVVGCQPLIWDIAGAVVEWNLEESSAERLLKAYIAAGRDPVPTETLAFYRMAYAAFRLGLCVHCAEISPSDERRRLNQRAERYRTQLAAQIRNLGE